MARNKSKAPCESIRDRIEFRNNHYYFKDIPANRHCDLVLPIGYSSVSDRPYLQTTINGVTFKSHRLINWLNTGEWPDCVDHIDGNTRNNHRDNLRSSTVSANVVNSDRKNKTNNVRKNTRSDGSTAFVPVIVYGGKQRSLGTYEDHHSAYFAAEFMRSLLYPGIDRNGVSIDMEKLKALLKVRIAEAGGLENL